MAPLSPLLCKLNLFNFLSVAMSEDMLSDTTRKDVFVSSFGNCIGPESLFVSISSSSSEGS